MTRPAGPVDEQLAAQMALLADGFVRGAAAEGRSFSYDLGAADRLDALVDLFLASRPAPGTVHSMALAMGAFVGELLVRADLGGWEWEPTVEAPGVRLRSGLLCFPIAKVGKRLTVGPEHDIAQFVAVAIDGVLPPEARRVGPPSGDVRNH